MTEPTTAAIEDYAKAIYALQRRGETTVSTTAIAERLGVTPGSASAMVKRLAERELVAYTPYRGVTLTPKGLRIALEVLRHHRLLELYLAEELGMPWDRVHAEAEVLEHVISEELEALIAQKLGHPELDPHGDPIPSVELHLAEPASERISDLEPGQRAQFTRISDSDPAMLRYLAERGIELGAELEIVDKQPFGGPVFARVGDTVHPLGGALADAMRATTVDRPSGATR